MELSHPIQILYEFEIRQILSPVIMLKITSKVILDIRKCKRFFKMNFAVFERKNLLLREKKKLNSFTCQSTINKFL